jgi:hypothetical protein
MARVGWWWVLWLAACDSGTVPPPAPADLAVPAESDLAAAAAPDLAMTAGASDGGIVGGRSFTFVNQCTQDVWVGSIGNPIAPPLTCSSDAACGPYQVCNPGNMLCTWAAPAGGGWALAAGASRTVELPPFWGGRFWPRTGCSGFNDTGQPACETGDCAGRLGCATGVGGTPPATLAEFTLIPPGAPVGLDFYDVSVVDGANLAVAIAPLAGSFQPTPPPGANVAYYCGSPGCTHNCGSFAACGWQLDATTCPAELRDLVAGHYVGCRSANQVCALDPTNATLNCAQERDLYGCTPSGPNAVSGSCYSNGASASCCGCPAWSPAGACQGHNPAWQLPSLPEKYAKVFKDACPTAYSFPYDDPTSTFTCQGTQAGNVGYQITFCP